MKRGTLVAALLATLAWALPGLAADLVYLNTPQGEERLLHAEPSHQFFAVEPYLESQENLAFCGPASIAAVMNSLEIKRPSVGQLYPYTFFTQDNVFNADTQGVKSYISVATRGMTLDEMAAFLNALGVHAEAHHADTLNLDQLRTLITATLADPNKRLISNFNRKLLGQAGAGHQSPLAAYDKSSDSVLMLDVAKFKYPPAWVKLADLMEAMRSVDTDSGKSRGLVVVEKPATSKSE